MIEYIEKYLSEMCLVVRKLSREDINRVIELLYNAWEKESNVYIMGNGGSASTASHFACDLAKGTVVEGKKRFKVIGLTDNLPLISALTNDDGFENIFSEQLKNHVKRGDVVIALSVHGGSGRSGAGLWSQNLLKAIQLAKQSGAVTIGFSGFDGGPLKDLTDACITIPYNSTAQVESFHLALEHLICNCLKEKIERS